MADHQKGYHLPSLAHADASTAASGGRTTTQKTFHRLCCSPSFALIHVTSTHEGYSKLQRW
eukprot:13578300-Ditylum_brightwellii.AAC.1